MHVWTNQSGRLLVAESPAPGEPFGRPTEVFPADAGSPQLAMDDAGNALLAWEQNVQVKEGISSFYVNTAYGSTRPVGKSWSPPRQFGKPVAGVLRPAVAVNPAGAAAVAWVPGSLGVMASYRPPGGAFGPTEESELSGAPALIALSDDGQLAVSGPFGGPQEDLVFAVRSPLGGWGEPVTVKGAGWALQLLPDRAGAISFVGSPTLAEKNPGLLTTRLTDGLIVGPTVFTPGEASIGEAATNRRGGVLIPWSTPGSWQARAENRVFVSERSETGALLPPVRVSGPGMWAMGAALNDAGQAVVLLQKPDQDVLATVREDPSAPALPLPPELDISVPPAPALDDQGDLELLVRCDRACEASPTGLLFADKGVRPARGDGAPRRLRAKRRGRLELRFDEGATKPPLGIRVRHRQGSVGESRHLQPSRETEALSAVRWSASRATLAKVAGRSSSRRA
jgi:hypothetical protein